MQILNQLVAKENYLDSFKKIANLLLNEYKLIINNSEFEITEIEFYYQDKVNHNDTSLHANEEQKNSNTWYVHTVGRGGLDITFGDGINYGGILIRGLKCIESNEYIDGPMKVIDKILEVLSISYKELQIKLNRIESSVVKIEKKQKTNKLLYQGARIGLVQLDNEFLVHPYRFIVDVVAKHKFKNKENVYTYTLKLNPKLSDQIAKDIGYKFKIEKYIQSLEKDIYFKQKILDYLAS